MWLAAALVPGSKRKEKMRGTAAFFSLFPNHGYAVTSLLELSFRCHAFPSVITMRNYNLGVRPSKDFLP